MATSIGMAGMEIPATTVELAVNIGSKVPLAKYACPGKKRLGEEVVKALQNANAAIMENHGVVAVGPDLKTAFVRALIVEEAARQFIFASLLGKVRALSSEEVEEVGKIISKWLEIQEIKNFREWMKEI
jgi:ribulose-5-phosphate 4-epimerase/fuculose-1-phosphate aldolase